MGYTKRQFVIEAFSEMGLADYAYDLSPEQAQSCGRRLDAMMAMWSGRGIKINYPIATDPENVDLDTETDVPDYANEAIILNLAIKIAPSHGKSLSPDTKASAKDALNTVLNYAAKPMEMGFPEGMPRGAGYKNRWRPFYGKPVDKEVPKPEDSVSFSQGA